MADLNALIAQGVQFKAPPDPFAQYAQMQQLQQGQQANQLNQMKMQEYQRGVESQNALRASPAPEGVNAQHWAIDPMEALKIQKSNAESANLALTGKKTRVDTLSARRKMEDQAIRDISKYPSDAQVTAHYEDMANSDLYSPAEKQQAVSELAQMLAIPFEQRKSMFASKGATAGDLSTAATAKAGQDITMRGQDITAATAKAGQESVAATAKASQNVTMRGQNLLDTREQENIAIRQEDQRRKGDPVFVQQMASANTLGQAIAKDSVLAQQVLPKVLDTAEQTLGQIDNLIGKRDDKGTLIKGATPHPGFTQAVGATWTPGARFIPGTDAADFQTRFDQVKGGAFLQAFETLKGGGAISDIEGAKGSAALNRMSTSQSEKEFVNAARDFQDIIRKGVERAKTRVGGLKSTAAPGASNIDSLLEKYK